MPARFGPSRSCTQAAIHRSKSTRYAAAVIKTAISTALLINVSMAMGMGSG